MIALNFKRSPRQRRKISQLIGKIIILIVLVCVIALPLYRVNAMTTGYLPEQEELFQKVLNAAKLTPEEVKIDPADLGLWGGDKYRLKLLDLFLDNPWKISSYSRTISEQMLAAKTDLAQLAFIAHRRIDAGVNPQFSGDLLAKYAQKVKRLGENALAVSLSQLTNQPTQNFINPQYKALPSPLRSAVAQFLFAIPDILHYRQLGLLRSLDKLQLDANKTYTEVVDTAITTVEEEEAQKEDDTTERVLLIESLLDNVDFKLLNTGAILTITAIQELQKQLSDPKIGSLLGDYEYNINTPQGRIILSGKSDSIYTPDDYLLIVDVAGNDTYSGGAATANIGHGISAILDLSGQDHYITSSTTTPSFGAGIFGYAVLMDMQGDDQYEAPYQSQGIGIFGTGILYDAEGKDNYKGIGNLQGSGIFGTGMLIDNQGSDRYTLYRYGQGYGFTKGVGLLLDNTGDDQYIGLEDKYPNGGPFGAEKHLHFAQGMGFGRRGDYTEGHSWAGGIGMLLDGAGNDRYECDIYGQGTGYWYSLGFLIDKAGDDYHQTGAYSLAGAPHFSVGIFQDESGNDQYKVRISQSLGKGRDWSIGWFEDSAGDDWYQGHHAILGSAEVNGIGVFWDKKGDDNYISFADMFDTEAAYGQSKIESPGGLRDVMLTLGLFVDGEGKDHYWLVPKDYKSALQFNNINDTKNLLPNPIADNDKLWCRGAIPPHIKRAYGCGIDAYSMIKNRI